MDLCWTGTRKVKRGFDMSDVCQISHSRTHLDVKPCDYDSLQLSVSKPLYFPPIVLFCFLSHRKPLSGTSFHLSILALCAVSNRCARYFRNVLIDVGQTLHFWRLLQRSDRMTWLITSLYTTKSRAQPEWWSILFKWMLVHLFSYRNQHFLRQRPNVKSQIFFIGAEWLFFSLWLFFLCALN